MYVVVRATRMVMVQGRAEHNARCDYGGQGPVSPDQYKPRQGGMNYIIQCATTPSVGLWSSRLSKLHGYKDTMASHLYPFVYDPAYPFLFYTLCRYGVLVPSTTDHLKSVHKDVPVGQRKVVRRATSQLSNMFRSKDEVLQFSFPRPESAPIPHIRPPVEDGHQCNECGWITTSETRRRMHVHPTEHRRRVDSPWRTGVRCQQLFANHGS